MPPTATSAHSRRQLSRYLGTLALALPALSPAGQPAVARKRSRCPRCPQRKCCACFDDQGGSPVYVSCRYLDPGQPCPCKDEGFGSFVIDPQPGQATICTVDNQCVQASCPVV